MRTSIPPRCRAGAFTGAFLLLAALPLRGEPEPVWVPSLDDSQVFITYGELRRLIEKAAAPVAAPKPPAPPVDACLTEARFQLRFDKSAPRLSARLTAENLADTWAALPLGALAAAAPPALPADTRLARVDGEVRWVLEKAGRHSLELELLPDADGAFEIACPAQAALVALELEAPPPELAVQIADAAGRSSRHEQAATLRLSIAQSPLRLSLVPRDQEAPLAAVKDTALVTTAQFQTLVAQDGAQFTSVSLRLEHGGAATLPLSLPAGAELLRCAVRGRPVPAETDASGALTLNLPAPSAPPPGAAAAETLTEVTLSYFLQGAALHSAEGEFDLTLPRTPLLIRQLDWTVELPEGLEASAKGNIALKASPAPQTNVLHLGRRLCRDSITQARVTYRHPHTPQR